jgi:hypothetical protein
MPRDFIKRSDKEKHHRRGGGSVPGSLVQLEMDISMSKTVRKTGSSTLNFQVTKI